MIRLIASDIDGTLLQNGEREISPRFFREASRLMNQGVAFCAASGRQFSSLYNLFAPIADTMYFICENGSVVFGPGNPPQLISKTVIDREISLELCRDILAIPGCELLISGTNMSYLCPKTPEYVDHIQNVLGNKITILPSPEAMPEDFVKISAYYGPGAADLEPLLKPKWEDTFQVAIAGFCWLDFTLADKGTGIRALSRALHFTPEEAMAFGDNFNDIAMLEAVGQPYLMAGAAEELRQRFHTQCPRVEDILETL